MGSQRTLAKRTISTQKSSAVGPRHIRGIGTPKFGFHIRNLQIKRPRITINLRIGSRKMSSSQSHICKIVD